MINEADAKRAKENMSFSDYKEGSATAEYNAVIAEATEQIEQAKSKVSEEGAVRLDKLLSWYKVAYASWMNKYNANGARHVSVMISGPSNYNMRAHEKYLNREQALWNEYDELKNFSHKVSAIVDGDKIIKTGDPEALTKLQEKLNKALAEHQAYKDHNVKARKENTEQLPAYVLQNSNGRIKAIKDRIAHIERLSQQESKTIETTDSPVKIVDNTELNRVQIFFPDKPNADIRNELKHNGFRWAPSNGSWQSFRTYNAIDKAQKIAEKY